MLLPRMLLFRPRHGGLVPFQEGQWLQLLEQVRQTISKVTKFQPVPRAKTSVQLGELSAARVALEGAEVAPGTLATLRELTNPERRPPLPAMR